MIGAFERGELGPIAATVDSALRGRLRRLLARGDFSGRARRDAAAVRSSRASRALGCCWWGWAHRLSSIAAAGAARSHSAVGRARAHARRLSAALALERPPAAELDDFYFGRAQSRSSVGAGLYRINDLKTARRPRPPALARVLLGPVDAAAVAAYGAGSPPARRWARARRCCATSATCRGNVCTPRYLAAQARDARAQLPAAAARARPR